MTFFLYRIEEKTNLRGEQNRPILRGRDIKKYSFENSDLWLLFIPWHFPLHADNSISGASLVAEEAFKTRYPAIYNHLFSYKNQLLNRNKAETGVRYEWYAMQRWGANYWEDFSKQKIIYPNMTKFLPFYYDTEGFFTNQKCFIITGENIAYLTAFLNSSLFKFCFRDNFPELQGGTRELSKIFFDQIPVLKISASTEAEFQKIIRTIQRLKNQGEDTINLEKEVDQLIFNLYELTIEERNMIGFIEIQ